MLRFVNSLLLLIVLVGACLSIRAGLEYQRLRARHRSLMAEVGLLRVSDPNQIHLVAIDTGEPLHFAWQMYVPTGFAQQWQVQLGGGGSSTHISSSSSEPQFDLVRVRIRKEPDGRAAVWVKHRGGSSYTTLPPREIEALERSQWPIEQLGADGVAVVDGQEVATLVRLSDPEASDKPPLMEIRFGSRQAFQNQQAAQVTSP
jgi:hypothetical protein